MERRYEYSSNRVARHDFRDLPNRPDVCIGGSCDNFSSEIILGVFLFLLALLLMFAITKVLQLLGRRKKQMYCPSKHGLLQDSPDSFDYDLCICPNPEVQCCRTCSFSACLTCGSMKMFCPSNHGLLQDPPDSLDYNLCQCQKPGVQCCRTCSYSACLMCGSKKDILPEFELNEDYMTVLIFAAVDLPEGHLRQGSERSDWQSEYPKSASPENDEKGKSTASMWRSGGNEVTAMNALTPEGHLRERCDWQSEYPKSVSPKNDQKRKSMASMWRSGGNEVTAMNALSPERDLRQPSEHIDWRPEFSRSEAPEKEQKTKSPASMSRSGGNAVIAMNTFSPERDLRQPSEHTEWRPEFSRSETPENEQKTKSPASVWRSGGNAVTAMNTFSPERDLRQPSEHTDWRPEFSRSEAPENEQKAKSPASMWRSGGNAVTAMNTFSPEGHLRQPSDHSDWRSNFLKSASPESEQKRKSTASMRRSAGNEVPAMNAFSPEIHLRQPSEYSDQRSEFLKSGSPENEQKRKSNAYTWRLGGNESTAMNAFSRARDFFSSDPFVTLKVGHWNAKSKVCKKSQNPKWDQLFFFRVPQSSDPVHFEVWDEKSPDLMGHAEVPWSSIAGQPLGLPLVNETSQGILYVQISKGKVKGFSAARQGMEMDPKFKELLQNAIKQHADVQPKLYAIPKLEVAEAEAQTAPLPPYRTPQVFSLPYALPVERDPEMPRPSPCYLYPGKEFNQDDSEQPVLTSFPNGGLPFERIRDNVRTNKPANNLFCPEGHGRLEPPDLSARHYGGYTCRVCSKKGVGNPDVCWCRTCSFDACPSCASKQMLCPQGHGLLLPPDPQDSSAYDCSVCQKHLSRNPDVRLCRECGFIFCPSCASTKASCPKGHGSLQPPDHDQPHYTSGYECSVCKQKAYGNSSVRWCPACNFNACPNCAPGIAKKQIPCPNGHQYLQPPDPLGYHYNGSYNCHVCQNTGSGNPEVRTCGTCQFDACPSCAQNNLQKQCSVPLLKSPSQAMVKTEHNLELDRLIQEEKDARDNARKKDEATAKLLADAEKAKTDALRNLNDAERKRREAIVLFDSAKRQETMNPPIMPTCPLLPSVPTTEQQPQLEQQELVEQHIFDLSCETERALMGSKKDYPNQRYLDYLEEVMKNAPRPREMQEVWVKAAIRIETSYRRSSQEKKYKNLLRGVLAIQTCFRRWKNYKIYQLQRKKAIVSQAWWRSRSSRIKFKVLAYAVLRAQTSFRKWRAERKFKACKKAAVLVETCFRRFSNQRKYQMVLKGILTKQTCFRRWTAQKKFKVQKKSAILIQSWWRLLVQRSKFKGLRKAAIVVETCFRRFSKENKYKSLLKAVLPVQTCFRKWRAHQKYQAQKQNAIRIQAWWRTLCCSTKFKALVRATHQTQTLFRKWNAERKFKSWRKAAIVVQTCFRCFSKSQTYQNLLKAVLPVQTCFRRWRAHEKYQTQKRNAIRIQAWWRAHVCSTFFKVLVRASKQIQRALRRWIAERNFKAWRKAAILVQTCFRQFSKTRTYQRWIKKAKVVQTCFRRWRFLHKYQLRRKKAIKVQTWWRSVSRWTKFQQLLQGTVKAQTCFRRKSAQRNFQRAKWAAIKMQTSFRSWDVQKDFKTAKKGINLLHALCRKLILQRQYRAMKKGVILLQARFHGRKAQRPYKAKKRSAICIQSQARKWRDQGNFKRKKDAAIKIQACFRRWYGERGFQRGKAAVIRLQALGRRKKPRRDFQLLKKGVVPLQARFRGRKAQLPYQLMKKSAIRIASWIRKRKCTSTFQKFVRATILVQKVLRGKLERLRLPKRRNAYNVSVHYDLECKQLLVANRMELYNIFSSYMDKVEPAIKRKEAALFALHFRFVPDITTKNGFGELITELVTILNDDPDNKVKIEALEAPLHFIAFLRLLILVARVRLRNISNTKTISLAESLSEMLELMDDSNGKQKMGGSLARNSFTSGRMIYAGSAKLPCLEFTRKKDLQLWLLEKHFRGSSSVATNLKVKTAKGSTVNVAVGSSFNEFSEPCLSRSPPGPAKEASPRPHKESKSPAHSAISPDTGNLKKKNSYTDCFMQRIGPKKTTAPRTKSLTDLNARNLSQRRGSFMMEGYSQATCAPPKKNK